MAASKHIRITKDQSFEKKQVDLQAHLKKEKTQKCDEDSLFQLDKAISDSLARLLNTLSQLPEIDRKRRTLRVMIKNAFMQRVTEKPLCVPPAIDWNIMQAKKFKARQDRKRFKEPLQKILNILHIHPCFILKMYESEAFRNDELLAYLKNLFPTKVYPNQQIGPNQPKLDSAVMISREQERVNLNLISFLGLVIKKEIGSKKSLKQVDFLSDDSIIGKLFYRILKS